MRVVKKNNVLVSGVVSCEIGLALREGFIPVENAVHRQKR